MGEEAKEEDGTAVVTTLWKGRRTRLIGIEMSTASTTAERNLAAGGLRICTIACTGAVCASEAVFALYRVQMTTCFVADAASPH